MGISIFNYWYHSKYDIPVMHAIIGELVVFVQDLSALDEEEDVKSMKVGGGIKMKTTRKFRFVLR